MLTAFLALLKRDLKLYQNQWSECFKPMLFFVMMVSLFPLLALNPIHLKEFAPAILWISLSVANMISAENILKQDFEDGSLLELLLSPHPLSLLLLAKLLAHWLVVGLPLLCMAPWLALFLNLPMASLKGICVLMIVVFPILSLLATMSASLVLGIKQSGLLLAIILLPLYIPILLFAVNATKALSLGLPWVGEMAFLIAIFLLLIMCVPFMMSIIIRHNVP